MSFAKIAVRETWNALATAATLAYAWTIYVLEGMEGVNRLVRMVSKRRVVPILRAFGAQIGSGCDIECGHRAAQHAGPVQKPERRGPLPPNGCRRHPDRADLADLHASPDDLPAIQQQMAKGPLTVIAYSQDDKTKLDEGKLALVDNEICRRPARSGSRPSFPIPPTGCGRASWSMSGCCWRRGKDGLTVAGSAVQQGPERRLCLCRSSRIETVRAAPRHGRADQRGAGPDRFRA